MIPGAKEFIQKLIREDFPFLFLTNNSQRNCRDVVAKLSRMGINVEEHHIFTCAITTARYLVSQKPKGTAYVIGEGGLLTALHQNGYSIVDVEPDYVVIGAGRTIMLESVVSPVFFLAGMKEPMKFSIHGRQYYQTDT